MADAAPLLHRFPALRRLAERRRGIPFCQQTSTSDCGAACLTMVLGHHGRHLALEEVRRVIGVDARGLDAGRVLRAARTLGLRGRGVQVTELSALGRLPRPAILHWRLHHFVVLDRMRPDGGADVIDPGVGPMTVDASTLSSSFTGVALALEPGAAFERGGRRPGLSRHLARLRPHSWTVGRVLAASLLLQLLALALPVLMGVLVDRVVPQADADLLRIAAAGVAVLVGFRFLAVLLRATLLAFLRARFDAQLSLDFLERLLDLPYSFFSQRAPGDILMRMDANAALREVVTTSALSALLDGTLATTYLALLFVAHPALGALALALGLARVAVFAATRRRHGELASATLQAQARSRGFNLQVLRGVETLKLSGAEDRALERFAALFTEELNLSLRHGRYSAKVDAVLDALGAAAPLAFLVAGGHLVLDGQLSLGTLLALAALAAGFWTPLTTLVTSAFDWQRVSSHFTRLEEVLDLPAEQAPGSFQPAPPLRGALRVEGLGFRYGPSSPPAVDDVSFEAEPGAFVAVVGPSGSGKSTLAGLLMGLHRPATGRVLVDGLDLWSLDLRGVRRQTGFVPQQPHFFGASVRETISFAAPDAPLAAVVEAARLAGIHDEIASLPLGYDTMIGDGGTQLSGGQRQRLALARALLQRPRLLILDEATSALDTLMEASVHRALAAMRATRIVIAHRLTTVVDADLVLVMSGGRIVERGRHAELSARHGLYAELWEGARAGSTWPRPERTA